MTITASITGLILGGFFVGIGLYLGTVMASYLEGVIKTTFSYIENKVVKWKTK